MSEQYSSGTEGRQARLRRLWFDKSCEALHLTAPSVPGGMAGCPLCMTAYDAPTAFTFEHAPPKSVRGSRLVLTCDTCNKWSGRHLDPHVAVAESFAAFAREEASQFVRFGMDGVEGKITVRAIVKNGNWSLTEDQKRSNPRIAEAIRNRMEDLAARGETPPPFNISWDLRHQPLAERIAWLRAGFLVVYASLGYRYALHPALNGIREQIRSPQALTLPDLGVLLLRGGGSYADRARRAMVFVSEPVELRSILVRMGQMFVLLPDLTFPTDFHARMARTLPTLTQRRVDFRGLSAPWPSGPRFVLDFDPGFMARLRPPV